MSFEPPAGILDIGNATLRVGKLEVAETTGLNQGLQNIVKNDLLITESTTYTSSQHWGLKLPTTWVGEFEVKGQTGKYVEFNFYNEGFTSNTSGYTLNFTDTNLTLKYNNGTTLASATIPTIVGTFRKVNIFLERNVIAVSVDGTQYLYDKRPSVLPRVISATGSAFLNLFVEDNSDSSLVAFKNLRIVNGRFISDETSNIAFIGGNLGVGVNSPKESLDIRGNMHLTRVSNVSQVSVDSNVVTEYTGPHDRSLRKYPEVALTAATTGGYTASQSSEYDASGNFSAWKAFDSSEAPNGTLAITQSSQYNNTSGTLVYAGDKDLLGDSNYKGEWIKLELPISIAVKKIHLQPRTTFFDQSPNNFKIVGSNDDSSWDVLYHNNTAANSTISSDAEQVHHMTHNLTKYYKYVALVANTTGAPISGNYVTMSLTNLEFYGYEEGSGSLDTTLKSVYNVPATTGTQLELYYDAKDYTQASDFTGNNGVLDKSGEGKHGTVNGTVGFENVNGIKAFTFGSGRIISLGLPSTFVGNQPHSVAYWIKYDVISGNQVAYSIKNDTSGSNNATPHAALNADGQFRYDFYNNDLYVANYAPSPFNSRHDANTPLPIAVRGDRHLFTPGKWYHVAITFSGGTHNQGTSIYINGKKQVLSMSESTTDLTLSGTSLLNVGANEAGGNPTDGSIASFRLYSKALNSEQVGELYDYDKELFFGSDTSIHIRDGNLGFGVSPTKQIELSSKYEGLKRYPPGDMTDYEGFFHGYGGFAVRASASYSKDFRAWCAFNNLGEDGGTDNYSHWFSPDRYTSGTGYYNFGHSSTTNDGHTIMINGAHDGSGQGNSAEYATDKSKDLQGEWIELQCPHKVKVSYFILGAYSDSYSGRQPREFTLCGSNNGHHWHAIKSYNVTSGYTNGGVITLDVGATRGYEFFRLVITRIRGGADGLANVSKFFLYGEPDNSYIDRGDTEFTGSSFFPVIAGNRNASVPRPERLVVELDTSKHSVVSISGPDDVNADHKTNTKRLFDTSGNGNHGWARQHDYHATAYDPEARALRADSGQLNSIYYIFNPYKRHDTDSNGKGVHFKGRSGNFSMSFWFKFDVTQNGTIIPVVMGDPNTNFNMAWIGLQGYTKWMITVGGGAQGREFVKSDTVPDRWYHVVGTWDGGGSGVNSFDDMRLFVDGEELGYGSGGSISNTSSGTLNITYGGQIELFYHDCYGQMSMFRLYDCVLTPSEIKQLYELGRFDGNKNIVATNVSLGIGKFPKNHFDVKGNASIGGNLGTAGIENPAFGIHTRDSVVAQLGLGVGYRDRYRNGEKGLHTCISMSASTTATVGESDHSVFRFLLARTSGWVPISFTLLQSMVNSDSTYLENQIITCRGRIAGNSLHFDTLSGGLSSHAYNLSEWGHDTTLFEFKFARHNRTYSVSHMRVDYFNGIIGMMDYVTDPTH
ncbi:MAG: hypothetical protein CL711_03115 [Chloroflexi bacterium]|nr:hypothetical protein [Chloroflexota bacterium]